MKKSFFFSCLLCLLVSVVMNGQDSVVAVSSNRYVQFDIGPGYFNTNLRSVNASLKSFGYKPLSEHIPAISASAGFFINRFLFRSELTVLVPSDKKQDNDITTGFGGHSIGFGIGYAVVQKSAFRLYPFAGFNTFTTRLKFEDNSPVSSMNNVINTPHRSSKMYFSGISLDLGLQAEKLIQLRNRKWDCPQNNRFMTMGIRAGYNIGMGRVKGKYNGHQSIADAPSYALEGPYVKLVFGLGSKLRDLKWKR